MYLLALLSSNPSPPLTHPSAGLGQGVSFPSTICSDHSEMKGAGPSWLIQQQGQQKKTHGGQNSGPETPRLGEWALGASQNPGLLGGM